LGFQTICEYILAIKKGRVAPAFFKLALDYLAAAAFAFLCFFAFLACFAAGLASAAAGAAVVAAGAAAGAAASAATAEKVTVANTAAISADKILLILNPII
jgi:hypothetical protein